VTGSAGIATLTRAEAEDFLYGEARLLDQRRFEEWLDLLTDDVRYLVPTDPGRSPGEITPIALDDLASLRDRVYRLRSPAAHAQIPAPATIRVISNVQVQTVETTQRVASNFVLYEVRASTEHAFAGTYAHTLRREAGQWRIAEKTVTLLARDVALPNLPVIL